MPRILVAEDSTTQAQDIRLMLEAQGYQVDLQADGRLALDSLRRRPPDLLLTDLHMPEMNGLELVEAVREEFPQVPVVLMTAYGSEDIAIEALLRGAASYVPKKILRQDLLPTLEGVLSLARTESDQRRVAQCLAEAEAAYRLGNDPAQAALVVSHVQETLSAIGVGDETERIRLGVALEEAIQNAIFHGNLELTSDELREAYSLEDGGQGYYSFLEQRRGLAPFRQRQVFVDTALSRGEVAYTVRDEGPGFDHAHSANGRDSSDFTDRSRGLVLMHSFMDEVRFNERGNEIRLVRRFPH